MRLKITIASVSLDHRQLQNGDFLAAEKSKSMAQSMEILETRYGCTVLHQVVPDSYHAHLPDNHVC